MDDVHGAEEVRLAPHHLLLAELEVQALAERERGVQLAQLGRVVVGQNQVVLCAAAETRQARRKRTRRRWCAARGTEQRVHAGRGEGRCVGEHGGADRQQRVQQRGRLLQRGEGRVQLAVVLQAALVAGARLARDAADAGNLKRPEIGGRFKLAAVPPHRQLALAAHAFAESRQVAGVEKPLHLVLVIVLQVQRQVLAYVARVLELDRRGGRGEQRHP